MKLSRTFTRPLGAAVAGTFALIAAFDTSWPVRWGVAVVVTYAAYGVIYWLTEGRHA